MQRADLEHILRAAGAITRVSQWIVFDASSSAAELYAPDHAWATRLLDASIGEKSAFHKRFGYYARGVKPPVLPKFWRERAMTILSPATGGVAGTCPSAADVAVSRLAAGRDVSVRHHQLCELLQELPPAVARRVEARLRRISATDTGRRRR
jgi:hypothetical protein